MFGPQKCLLLSLILMVSSAVFGEGIFVVGFILFVGCSALLVLRKLLAMKVKPIIREDFKNFALEKRVTENHARNLVHAYTEDLCPVSLEEENRIISSSTKKGTISKYILVRSTLDYLEANKKGYKTMWLKMFGFNSMEDVKSFL